MMAAAPQVVEGLGTVYNDGGSATVKYITGYLVEKSLAVDNIFVIAMIFAFFAVPRCISIASCSGASSAPCSLRGVMIAVGAQLIQQFTWIIYVFGAFLILTGVKMLALKAEHTDPNKNVVCAADAPADTNQERFHGQHFFVRPGQRRVARRSARRPLETDRVD